MIDLHCHILPNLDDGPSSIDESLAMARRAVEDGIHTIVATPHTLNGMYLNSAEAVRNSVAVLQEALEKNDIALTLYPGADVHLYPNLLGQIQDGNDNPTPPFRRGGRARSEAPRTGDSQ